MNTLILTVRGNVKPNEIRFKTKAPTITAAIAQFLAICRRNGINVKYLDVRHAELREDETGRKLSARIMRTRQEKTR